jgi:hypothetical protein
MGDRLGGDRVVSGATVLPMEDPKLPEDGGADGEVSMSVKDRTGNNKIKEGILNDRRSKMSGRIMLAENLVP